LIRDGASGDACDAAGTSFQEPGRAKQACRRIAIRRWAELLVMPGLVPD